MNDYLRLEGLAYRFVPQLNPSNNLTAPYFTVDTDIMYENLITKFDYGNMELPGVYLDETNRRSCNLRTNFGRLANELVEEGKKEKALEVLDFAMAKMPVEKFGCDGPLLGIIEAYTAANAFTKADSLIGLILGRLEGEALYFHSVELSRSFWELKSIYELFRYAMELKDVVRTKKISALTKSVSTIDYNEISLPLSQWLALMDALQNPYGDSKDRNNRTSIINNNQDIIQDVLSAQGENLSQFKTQQKSYEKLAEVHAFMLKGLSEGSKESYLRWQSEVNDINADFKSFYTKLSSDPKEGLFSPEFISKLNDYYKKLRAQQSN